MPSGFEEGPRRFEVVLGKLQAPTEQGQRGSSRLARQGREIALRSGCVAQFEMRFRGAFERGGGVRRVEDGGAAARLGGVKDFPRGAAASDRAARGARRCIWPRDG